MSNGTTAGVSDFAYSATELQAGRGNLAGEIVRAALQFAFIRIPSRTRSSLNTTASASMIKRSGWALQ